MSYIKLKDIIFGYTLIKTEAVNSTKIADILFRNAISFKTVGVSDGVVSIKSTASEKRVRAVLGDKEIYTIESGGLPIYLLRRSKRVGLLVGLILCVSVIGLSSMLIWDVEVKGNEGLSDDYIEDILIDYGIKKGRFRQSVDLDALHHQVLLDNGAIGWLRVNFRGSVAVVEVLEYRGKDGTAYSSLGSNLVSARDAFVVSVITINGVSSVKEGDTVKAGELLIGGICDSNMHGYSLKNAEGSVIGEVCDKFAIKIPFETSEKRYTGKSFTEKSIEILGKRIKLSKKGRNLYGECDIIETRKRLEPFDVIKLPVEVCEVIYNEYESKAVVLSEEQAFSAAKAELNGYLRDVSLRGDVISISTQLTQEDDCVILDCTVFRTEDICKRIPLSTKQ